MRVAPSRFLNPQLAAVGGGSNAWQYVFAATVNPVAVRRNATVLTRTTTLTSTYDTWFWDESTRTLSIVIDPGLSFDPEELTPCAEAFVCDYELYWTSGEHRVDYRDPLDDTTAQVLWEPRIRTPPTFTQNVDSIEDGVFSIGSSPVEIVNSGNYIQQYLTVNDSFHSKPISVWYALNGEKKLVYVGLCNSLRVSTDVATLAFVDAFSKFRRTATFGDGAFDSVLTEDWGYINPSDKGRPIPMFFGKGSRGDRVIVPAYVNNCAGGLAPDPKSANRGINIDYSPANPANTDSIWLLGRVPPGGIKTLSFGTLTGISVSSGTYTAAWSRASTSAARPNVQTGDTFSVTVGVNPYYGTIMSDVVDDVGGLTGTYTFKLQSAADGTIYSAAITYTAAVFGTGIKGVQACVYNSQNGKIAPLTVGRDFGVIEEATSGGNTFVLIQFISDLITTWHPSSGVFPDDVIDPAVHEVYFILEPAGETSDDESETDEHRARNIVKAIVEHCGMTMADIPPGSTEGIAVRDIAQFQVPYFDEIDPNDYLKYLQDLLGSVGAMLYITADGEIGYRSLLSAFTVADYTHDSVNITDGSWFMDVDFNDIITSIIAYNPHAPVTGSHTLESPRAKYLHGIDNPRQVRHLMYDGEAATAWIYLKTNRKVLYSFASSVTDIDRELAGELMVDTARVAAALSESATQKMLVVGVERGLSESSVTVTEGSSDDKINQGY